MGLLLFIITLALSLGVQFWLRTTYGRWNKVQNTSGLTGAETARAILNANELQDVKVEAVGGVLSDHYDPRTRTVRLSQDNYSRASVAGSAVAAHEVGHAIQHAKAYAPLQWRSTLVPVANIGGNFAPLVLMFGFMTGINSALGGSLIQIGIFFLGCRFIPAYYPASRI